MATLLGTTQHRDVAVHINGRDCGVWDKHEPGEAKNGAEAHRAGGSTGWRVKGGLPEIEEGSLTRTFDPDTDFWLLAYLTQSVANTWPVSIVDVFRSPASGVKGSRKYSGFVSSYQDPESDAKEANVQMLVIKYVPDSLPTS